MKYTEFWDTGVTANLKRTIMKKLNFILIIFLIMIVEISAQSVKKMPGYFGETFRIDSVDRLLLTVQYNSDLYSGKFSFTDYY